MDKLVNMLNEGFMKKYMTEETELSFKSNTLDNAVNTVGGIANKAIDNVDKIGRGVAAVAPLFADAESEAEEMNKSNEVFHNENGEDYDVIERSKSGKNALLNRGKQWIIAWNCPKDTGSWGQGHYFFDEASARDIWEKKYMNESLNEEDSQEFSSMKLKDFVEESIWNALDNIAIVAASKVPGYDADWALDDQGMSETGLYVSRLTEEVLYELLWNAPVDESLQESLKSIYRSLNEAEMSDEDRKDSELIRSIYNKIQKRVNAALTPEEKEVMKKYGLVRSGQSIMKPDPNSSSAFASDVIASPYVARDADRNIFGRTGRYSRSKEINPQVNLADKARKVNQRRAYTNSVVNQNDIYSNDTTFDHDKKYKQKTFQDMERVRQNNIMYEPVHDMKSALRDRKYHEKEADKIDATYQKKLADLEKQRQWDMKYHKGQLDSANDKISKLLKGNKE